MEAAMRSREDTGKVLDIQHGRATAYQALDDAFGMFIKTKAEGPWRHAMGVGMTAFQELSTGVRDIMVADGSTDQLSTLLRTLQDLEREKLRLTMSLYSLKTPLMLKSFSWQQDGGVRGPPHDHHPSCGCTGGHGHGDSSPPVGEPTQAEHEAAMQELTRQLQDNIVRINDVVDELRQLAAEDA